MEKRIPQQDSVLWLAGLQEVTATGKKKNVHQGPNKTANASPGDVAIKAQ